MERFNIRQTCWWIAAMRATACAGWAMPMSLSCRAWAGEGVVPRGSAGGPGCGRRCGDAAGEEGLAGGAVWWRAGPVQDCCRGSIRPSPGLGGSGRRLRGGVVARGAGWRRIRACRAEPWRGGVGRWDGFPVARGFAGAGRRAWPAEGLGRADAEEVAKRAEGAAEERVGGDEACHVRFGEEVGELRAEGGGAGEEDAQPGEAARQGAGGCGVAGARCAVAGRARETGDACGDAGGETLAEAGEIGPDQCDQRPGEVTCRAFGRHGAQQRLHEAGEAVGRGGGRRF